MKEIYNYIHDNINFLYYVLLCIGVLYTGFRVCLKLLSKTCIPTLIKLITSVPESIEEIRKGQKDIYKELNLQNKLVTTIIDSLELAQILCDHEGKCMKVNSRWTNITGVPQSEALGFNWLKSVHPDDRDRIQYKWAELIENKAPFSETFRYINKSNNTVANVECDGVDVVGEDGERLYILGLSKLISIKKEHRKTTVE